MENKNSEGRKEVIGVEDLEITAQRGVAKHAGATAGGDFHEGVRVRGEREAAAEPRP